jgi:hypothetical protein
VFESLEIRSASGLYEVEFDQTRFTKLSAFITGGTHFILDAKLAKCYPDILREVIYRSPYVARKLSVVESDI